MFQNKRAKSNVLPTKATALVNARLFPDDSAQSVKQYVEQIIDDDRVTAELSMTSEPSPVSATDSVGFNLISQAIRDLDANALVAPYLVQGGTGSKYFYAVSDNVYRFLPMRVTKESLQRLHGIDEQIAISDYIDTIRFYWQIISTV